MKKVVAIILCLIIIISISIIGYTAVSANTEVEVEENIIDKQNELQEYYKSYGYTIDNPNVIINPYEISPLTALIIFETSKEEEITIIVEGKTKETTYINKFEKSKTHYIPVYGLYADSVNKVKIKSNKEEKIIEIKTEKLPENLKNDIENTSDKPLFITSDKYTYAIDQNNDIRWYLTKKYSKKITRLSNNNLLLSTDKKTENNYNTGLVEIDLLGKIYKEYKIKTGYYGSYTELTNSILILSKDLLEIDKQTGSIINKVKLSDIYKTVDIKNNIITLTNLTKELKINKDTKEEKDSDIENSIEENTIPLEFYSTNKNYKLETGISFDIKQKTQTSNKNFFLINYKKPDNNYKKYNIKLIQEPDRLVVKGNFKLEDKVYIILEKFIEKKVYNVEVTEEETYKYINNEGLKGKYSIYIKINDNTYKTNKYVNF